MRSLNSPFFRVGILAAVILMIFSMPAREFLKLTFIFGIPFIIFLSFMVKKPKYSAVWIISIIGLLVIAGGYIYMLTDLPERIETRRIIGEGAALVAEGKYDQAITEYQKLKELGRAEQMQEKITEAEKEKNSAEIMAEARQLLKDGDQAAALQKLDSIPDGTRVSREASRMLKEIKDD